MTLRPLIRSLLRGQLRSPLDRRGGWSPAILFAAGEQGAWYDPSDFSTQFQDSAGTTPVTAAGQLVGKVLDKSGRGNHLIQATATSRPVLQQDASGFWYWSFDGVDDSWATAAAIDLSATSKVGVWTGAQKASDAATGLLCELTVSASATNGGFNLSAPGGPAVAAYGVESRLAGAASEAVRTSTSYAAPISKVLSAMFDGSIATLEGGGVVVRVNSVQETLTVVSGTTTGTGNFGNATFFVGRRGGATLPLNGRIYQLVMRGAVSTATQITQAERFVGNKMGIAL